MKRSHLVAAWTLFKLHYGAFFDRMWSLRYWAAVGVAVLTLLCAFVVVNP